MKHDRVLDFVVVSFASGALVLCGALALLVWRLA